MWTINDLIKTVLWWNLASKTQSNNKNNDNIERINNMKWHEALVVIDTDH